MKVELVFNKNQLTLAAGEVHSLIENTLSKYDFGLNLKVESVTIMSKYMDVLLDFPELKESPPERTRDTFHAIAGAIVIELVNYAVRYRHFEIHGEGKSLLFKKDWRGDQH
jgi:hypothetical protein